MKKVSIAVLTVGLVWSIGAFAAFDADTIAFYPFTDKAPGETAATGGSVTNAVTAGSYAGSVRLLGTSKKGYGRLSFESFPCPYVYSDSTCTNLLTASAQAIHITTNGSQTSWSSAVSFSTLAAALNAYKGDYTIECFWKDDASTEHTGLYDAINTGTTSTKFYEHYLRFGWSTMSRIGLTTSKKEDTYYLEYDSPVNDGYWHHLAIVYDSAAKTVDTWGDYERTLNKKFNDTKSSTAAKTALVLGANQVAVDRGSSGLCHYNIQFACLRVTKRKLEVPEFMRAYAAPLESYETLSGFHWGMEGSDGEAIDFVKSREKEPTVVALDWLYCYRNWNRLGLTGGGSECQNPVYRVESDRVKTSILAGGKTLTNNNLGSGELIVAQKDESDLNAGYGFSWSTNHYFSAKTAFSMECLIRLNLQDWQAKVLSSAGDEARWAPLMGRMLESEKSGSWAGLDAYGALLLRASPAQNGLTSFEIAYAYYDANRLPQGVRQTVCIPGKSTVYYMPNADFARAYHHFAYTYDPGSLKLCLYIDYEQYASIDLPGELVFDHSPAWQFGTGYGCCAFSGWYDEIRLTRSVLDASDFIKLSRPNKPFMILYRKSGAQ